MSSRPMTKMTKMPKKKAMKAPAIAGKTAIKAKTETAKAAPLKTAPLKSKAGGFKTAADVIDKVGGTQVFADWWGVVPQRVSGWRKGSFPAELYIAMSERLKKEHGITGHGDCWGQKEHNRQLPPRAPMRSTRLTRTASHRPHAPA